MKMINFFGSNFSQAFHSTSKYPVLNKSFQANTSCIYDYMFQKNYLENYQLFVLGSSNQKIVGIPFQVKPIHSKVDQTQNLRFQDYPLRSISNYDGAIYLLGPQYT